MNLRSSEFVNRANLIFSRARELGVRDYILIINHNRLKVVGWRMKPTAVNDNEAKS